MSISFQFQIIIEIVDKQGNLKKCNPDLPVHASDEPFSWQYFKEFIQFIISASIYQKLQTQQQFQELIQQVVEEINTYYHDMEDNADLNELAGYFIDELDVDFNKKISEDDAYLIAEWINDGYFRMTIGDYDMLINCEDQIKLLPAFNSQNINIKDLKNKYQNRQQSSSCSSCDEEYEDSEESSSDHKHNQRTNTRTITF